MEPQNSILWAWRAAPAVVKEWPKGLQILVETQGLGYPPIKRLTADLMPHRIYFFICCLMHFNAIFSSEAVGSPKEQLSFLFMWL